MGITKEMIGANIKAAREAAGLSLRDLADEITREDRVDGLSYSVIQRIESGQRKIASHELVEFADVLGTTTSRLLGRRERSSTLALAARITEEVSIDDLIPLRQRVVEILEARDLLDRLQGSPPVSISPQFPSVPATRTGGRTLATSARELLGLGVAPIADLAELVETRFGAHVIHQPLGIGKHGFCVIGEGIAVIVVNSSDSWGRQRFTLAHELCHLIVKDLDSWELTATSNVTDKGEEDRADDFAAHFLAPDQGVREMAGKVAVDAMGVMRIAMTFGISRDSALIRLRDLRLIRPTELNIASAMSASDLAQRAGLSATYADELAKRGRTTPPSLLTERVINAYTEHEVGLGLVAQVVGNDYYQELRPQLLASVK